MTALVDIVFIRNGSLVEVDQGTLLGWAKKDDVPVGQG